MASQFAQGVYLGIAPVKLQENENRIIRGRLITVPRKNDLVLEVSGRAAQLIIFEIMI
jgi:hypothetical protein